MNDLDTASIRALYDEHGAALWRYAVRLTGDRAHAEAATSTAKPVTGERRRDRDIAEAHRSAIARFVDWLRNRVGPVRTGVRGAR
jgi:RNA polymerase sigma-70 factor (ECF subfamily)